MGRKRGKNRLKHRHIRQGRGKTPVASDTAGQVSPFDDLWFWLSLATIDFCALLGMGTGNGEEQTPDKENTE
jgi:hypothetical protein